MKKLIILIAMLMISIISISETLEKIIYRDGTYTATESFFTMNLECICSIRCLGDTFIENV